MNKLIIFSVATLLTIGTIGCTDNQTHNNNSSVSKSSNVDSSSSSSADDKELLILQEMSVILNKRQEAIHNFDIAYNEAMQSVKERGLRPNSTAKMLHYCKEINKCHHEYIRLARKLSDNTEIIEEENKKNATIESAMQECIYNVRGIPMP